MTDSYALPLARDIYDCKEFTSLFQPRIHRQAIIADHAAVQCQLDLYGEEGVGSKFGSMNVHAGDFVSLCAPNCLPHRLALVAYTVEMGFQHDDEVDSGTDEQILQKNEIFRQNMGQSGASLMASKVTEAAQRKSEVQAKLAAELIRQDPVFGKYIISCWEAFLKTTEDGRNLDFGTMDSYLAFRVDDAAAVWTMSLLRWGSGIDLTPEEEHISGPIAYVAYAALSLTNDLLSWNKEYRLHVEKQESTPWLNAVNLVMAWHELDQEAAKKMVRDEIRAHEKRFCQPRDEYASGIAPSNSVLRWLKLLEDAMAGNFIWSVQCPRYSQNQRNPYREHLDTFGKDVTKVITVPMNLSGPVTSIKTSELTEHEKIKKPGVTNGSSSLTQSFAPKQLKAETVLSPYEYIDSLPSKNVRQTMIMALTLWYKVPKESLLIIERIINFLHNSSLLLDDIQDGSSLRRGKPAAHCIFGIGQTINTATHLMNEALCLVQGLSQSAQKAYSEEMRSLHIGQGRDLHWSYHTHVPSQEEYIQMVDGKTGGLFRLICRLMSSEASINRNLDLTHFATLLGRYFQIRDDYQNLTSADYTQSKGFCDDLDEGKISFPVILAMNCPEFPKAVMLSIFQSRHERRHQTLELKKYILDQMTSRGILSQTRTMLKQLHFELLSCLSESEEEAGGIENWTLRLLLTKLDIGDERKNEPAKEDSAWKIIQRKVWEGHWNGRPMPVDNAAATKKRKRV